MPLIKTHNSPEAKKARRLLENKFSRAIIAVEAAGLDEKQTAQAVKALQAKFEVDMTELSAKISAGKLPKEEVAKKKVPVKKKAAKKSAKKATESADAPEL